MHVCPAKPCKACWDEARGVGAIVVIFGLLTLLMFVGI